MLRYKDTTALASCFESFLCVAPVLLTVTTHVRSPCPAASARGWHQDIPWYPEQWLCFHVIGSLPFDVLLAHPNSRARRKQLRTWNIELSYFVFGFLFVSAARPRKTSRHLLAAILQISCCGLARTSHSNMVNYCGRRSPPTMIR